MIRLIKPRLSCDYLSDIDHERFKFGCQLKHIKNAYFSQIIPYKLITNTLAVFITQVKNGTNIINPMRRRQNKRK